MRKRSIIAAICGLSALFAGVVAAAPAATADSGLTFTVNSTGDGYDAKVGDGICATTVNTCSLRAAIQEADAATVGVTINFALAGTGPFTITPTTKLPNLTNPVGITINGYSQPGSAPNTATYGSNAVLMVQIKGNGAGSFDGLYANAGSNTFEGLSIYNFKHSIYLEGSNTNHNQITGNFICTDAAGQFRATPVNGGAGGIIMQDGSSYNTVGVSQSYTPSGGPPSVADRNVISGCAHRGVIISYAGTRYNHIQDNLIGLNPSGTAALPDLSHGVDINYSAQYNLVGGPNPGEGNVISGDAQEGVEVSHGDYNRGNDIIDNCIGTSIDCQSAPSYAANGMMGIRLEGEKTCDPCDPNAGYSTVTGNVVVNSAGGMLIDKGQQHNDVYGNWIGVLKNGTPAPNTLYGIRIEHGAVFNTIGPSNQIANNPVGIEMDSKESQPPSSYVLPTYSNTITQNSIYNNTTLGIDLEPYNQANVGSVATDPSVENGIATPTLTKATATTLTGTACAGCTVEVYKADISALGNGTLRNYGQGEYYLGSVTASSSDGSFTYSGGGFTTGDILTVDATDSQGDTSEFARDIAANIPPSPSIIAGNITYPNQSAFPISGKANAGDSINVAATDGTNTVNGTATVTSNGNYALKLNVSSLSDGKVTLTATATENGGTSPATTKVITKQSYATAPKTTVTPTASSVIVHWTPSSSNGGSAIDGYRVTLLQGSTVVSQVTTSPTATTTTFSGLPQNTAYTVTVEAHTAAGYGPASTVNTSTTIITAVTLSVSSTSVPAGGSLTVSGVLTRKDTGAGLASQNIEIDRINSDNSITVVTTSVGTDSNGNYTYTFTPSATGKYRAVFNGAGSYGYSKSPPSATVTYNG